MTNSEQIQENNPLAAIATKNGNAERLETLRGLYPDLFTNEGMLNITELQKLTDPNSINETEKFEFKWFGKSQAKRNAFSPTNATLVFDEARSVNPHTSQNIIIEGENLEVLKLLKEGYREKIKCIYIDPPYNTGKDFVYSDNFTQDKKAYWQDNGTVNDGVKVDSNTESDGRYHSHWLNMMFSRLLLARELLTDDGVIFISIDDNEVHHLRKLCDEVFGEGNFVGQLIWKRRASSAMADNNVSTDHEYVICYKKNQITGFSGYKKDFQNYSNPDDDARGAWVLGDLTVGMTSSMRPNQAYDLIDPATGNVYPVNPNRVWAYIPESMDKMVREGRVFFPKDSSKRPMQKRFKDELKSDYNPLSSLLLDKVGLNTEGTRAVQEVLGGNVFDYSKPVSLLKTLIPQVCNNSDIVLDFFGGSGTTGQAVMELNKEDGGNRQFILVQLPEQTDEVSEAYKAGYKKISDITIARNQKVVERLQAVGYETGFKVFKLAMSNFPRVMFELDPNLDEAANLQRLQQYINEKERQLFNTFDEANLLTEILIKRGFNLNYQASKAEQFAKNNVIWVEDGIKKCFVCLDNALADETVSYFTKNTEQHFICLERALDTTKKWNLKHAMGHLFFAF
ncbi:MAG: site-specific DNA-methyltransferase [Methylococcaceae bacterium]|nr:site-specific DNA-methyltransferase [Methylococcaceae bacterium]